MSVAAVPVGASVVSDDEPSTAVVVEANIGAADTGGYSDARLAGTGVAFLLLGIGTLSVASKRRWQTIDLRAEAGQGGRRVLAEDAQV